MELLESSDSEMSAVADSESDVDDNVNLYTNRLMCADSLSSPRLKVLSCAIECSPVIERLSYRRLAVEKTALIPGKINASRSTSVSSGSYEEAQVCDGFKNGIKGSVDPEGLGGGTTQGAGCGETLRRSQRAGGSWREGAAQVGVSRPADYRALRSRSFSEKQTLSRTLSARSCVNQRHKPASNQKPGSTHMVETSSPTNWSLTQGYTKHTIHARSGYCVSRPAVAEECMQQARMSCQSPPQSMGRRKTAQGPAHTPSESACRRDGAKPESSRRLHPLTGRTQRKTQRKRKAAPESELSVSETCPVNLRKRKYPLHSHAQAESAQAEECSRTQNRKRKAGLRSRGGSLHLSAINRLNLRGETLLHRAVMDSDLQLTRHILQRGGDVNRADYAGWTPLHEAMIGGCCEIAAALLEAGALVNCIGDEGITPLHDAIDYGHHQVAQLLLDHGADPSLKNEEGQTALDMTDDNSLRKLMERYLPRARRTSLPAQRRSNRTSIQEGGNGQKVACGMRKKEEESTVKPLHGLVEAVRSRRSFRKADRTSAEQGAGVKPSTQITSPSLRLRSRSVILPLVPDDHQTSPKGQSALPAEAQSQGCTESEVSLSFQDSVIPNEDIFEISSLDRATDCEAQEVTISSGKEIPVRVKSVRQKPKGTERRGERNGNGQVESAGQSPECHSTTSQSPEAQRTISQSPVTQRTKRTGQARNDSQSTLSSVLCEAGNGELSAERQDNRDTEQDGRSTDFTAALASQPGSDRDEPSKLVKPEDRKAASVCLCSRQDVQSDADMNLGNSSFSFDKIRSKFLDYDLGKQIPEYDTIPCHVHKVFDEIKEQRWVENTQEQQGDLQNSRSPNLAGSMRAENKTRTKGPLTLRCEMELQDDTESQTILADLPEEDTPGTTSDLILGISVDPVINAKTSDLLQNIHGIQRDKSGYCTVGRETLRAPEIFRDTDLSANMSGESGMVLFNPGGCGMEENSEECSISLLAPHSDVLRHRTQQCPPCKGDREDKMQPDALTEEPTLTLESDSSTPSLLFENLNKSEELSPTRLHMGCNDRLHVVSSVNESCDHGASSKVINPENKTTSSSILMQREPPDSHVKDYSLPCSMEGDQSDLCGLKSRIVAEPVQMTGVSSPVLEFPAASHSSSKEHQEKSVQSHIVAEPLDAIDQVSCLTETNGNKHSPLISENTNRARGRIPVEGCSWMTCSQTLSPSTSGNGVPGREMEGKQTEKILKITPERPGLKWEEQLLKENLLCNSATINFSCSKTQVTSTIQESEKTSLTECYMPETELRNGKERLLPKSNEINSLNKSNSKDMELACSMGRSFDFDVNDATVREEEARAEDGTESSYDSDCTMISETNYMDSNTFGTDLENACLNPDSTLGSTTSQVKDNAKHSFENAFGISRENSSENHKGNLASSPKQNLASGVDSGIKTSNVGKYLDVQQQNKHYSNFFGQQSKEIKASKAQSTRSGIKEEEHKSEHNALLKKHAAGREKVCAIACAATTSCRGPQRILKLPVRNINKRNSRGESLLHVASKKGDLALVRALIEAGINVNQADYAGWTALHEASAQGHSAVVQELLQSGADVNSRGLEGLTPLHDAVTSNHYETVKLLIQYGSNRNDQNVFGKTPLNLKCDKGIKELLSTFHGPFVSPEEGSSKPSSAAVRGKPAALSCESESGIQPNKESHCCTNLESTITILESVEKKQKEMSAWELTGPDDIGKFTEAFSQIQDVLNHVLNKHKAENRELTRKYRIASDSFKQGILRKQLMSLASRQKCLLRSLQKQNSLKLSVQTQSCSLLSPRPSTQLPPAGENQPGADTVPGTYIGPYRTTQQEPPLNCDSVEAPLSPLGVEVPLSPRGVEVPLNSRGVEVPLNSRGVEVPLKSQGEEVPLSSRGIEAPLNSRGAISEETPSSHSLSSLGDSALLHDSSESTHITSDTESGEPEPNVDALGSCSEVAVHRENTPCADIVLRLESGRSETGPVQPTISANQSPSFQQTAGARSDQQRSDSIGENVHCSPQVGVLIVSNNTAYIVSSSLTDKQHTSQTHQTRPSATPLAPSSSFLQGVNSGQPPDWVTAKQNALSVNETLAAVTACQVPDKTSLGEALSHGVQKSSCEAAVPQYGDTTVGNRQLISLIQCGVIKPGDQVLQLTLKGCTYRASLLPDGSIKDMKGQFFLSPEEWVMSLLGPNIPITSAFAWKKVTYRSKSLLMYLESPDLAASQAFPVVTPCTEETGRSSISNFMDIKKILLISHEEFMPSRLMDQYWDTFSQSEDWEI